MSKSIDFGFPKNHIWLRQGLDRWYTRYAENDAGGASNCGFSMEKGTSTGRCFDVFFYSQMDFRCRWFLPESNIVGRLTSETEKSGEIDDQCLRGWPRSPASVLFCCRVLNQKPWAPGGDRYGWHMMTPSILRTLLPMQDAGVSHG